MQRRGECKSPGNIFASIYQSSLSKFEVEDGDDQAGDIDREMEENALHDINFRNIPKFIVKEEFPVTTPPLLVLNGPQAFGVGLPRSSRRPGRSVA